MIMLLAFSNQPLSVPMPSKLVEYSSPDKSISLLKPENWKISSRSAQAVSSELSLAPAQNVTYKITSDLAGSLMADVARPMTSSGEGLPAGIDPQLAAALAPQKSSLQTLHELEKMHFSREYKNYEEGVTEPAQIAGTEALVTEFKFKDGSSFAMREIVGKRVTLLTNERRISIVFTCPRVMKALLFPVFNQMTESIQLNKGGGS